MNDRDALYRAVLDNPDDDTLRLVYADALEESGDPRRAAFIRTHVELSRLPEYDPFAIRSRYHDQKKKVDGGRWITELPPLPDGLSWARDPFRRGLPGAIQANNGGTFVAHADELFARYPIESLELAVTRVADTAELAACPWLNRLRSLSFVQGAGGPAARRLLNSEHFERLTDLHLGSQLTTQAAVAAVVRSRVFPQLTGLSAREDRPGGGSLVGALARLSSPPRLKKLDLSGNRLSADSLDLLVTSAALRTVEDLDLSDNNLGEAGLTALAGAMLPNLRALHLLRTRPTVEGVAALVGAGFFSELRSLTLGGNNLASTAATWVAGAPAANLRVLNLHENRVGDRGAESLAKSANLAGLLVLDVAEAHIGDAGAEALARSEHLNNLMYLNLYGNAIDSAPVGRLRKRFGDRVFL
ncbi:Leucine Rich repeats (2 copies) [Gemmata sp. SH-PL17]|uniref:TIGR02996 domain-containing protein n=1 Tax=Gemmata sp. SH-PL17 TaxID=1630693 RepID=UPI00078E4A55|nr:TIGR02996 domain-containing protein [Gemmata sp. SH-PL17]AMV23562.1 Leucine Rich repeats (2 copies) [Gemmata sp. SH-PL17]